MAPLEREGALPDILPFCTTGNDMDTTASTKVYATIHGRRYGASLANDGVLILGGGRAIATAEWKAGRLVNIKPTPPDFVVQMPLEDLDVIDTLARDLRAATAGTKAAGTATRGTAAGEAAAEGGAAG
jgi:hypothetical protein